MAEFDRNKKLAEIKSSIELLEECKQKVNDHPKLDEMAKKDRTEQIDEAIKENYDKARLQFQATKKEVDTVTYNEVTEEYKAKYEKHLKAKGITDEQLHQKEQAVVTTVTAEDAPIRKRHRRTKRTEMRDDENGFDPTDIKRLDNEEELMKASLIKDKKDLERRRHRSTDTMSDVPKNPKSEDVIGTVIKTKKIKPREENSISVTIDGEKENKRENMRILEKNGEENKSYTFDPSEIPSYIQYDVLPLPSNGECYAHKKNRIPVAYLTAADENIIASPNMYRDGKIIDIILERKILDKDIKVEELCKGDRDAIVLWLRATGYGTDFPIIARHPDTGKEYPINIKLDTFKYYPFNLKGDENGYFEYVLPRTKQVVKLKKEEKLLQKLNKKENEGIASFELNEAIEKIKNALQADKTLSDANRSVIIDANTKLQKWAENLNSNANKSPYTKTITNTMETKETMKKI